MAQEMAFPKGTTCPKGLLLKNLNGKVVIVTGASAGIGRCLTEQLAKQGATVIMACRNPDKTSNTVSEIKAQVPNAQIVPMALDLTDLDSIRKFSTEFNAKYQHLDVLMNNAGVMAIANRETTKQGFEMQIGTNHFGHFLLTELLLDTLKRSAPSRIVNVSSDLHFHGKLKGKAIDDINCEKRPYSRWQAYNDSKLANVLHAKNLAKRLEGTGVTAVALHPGVVNTELMRHLPGWVLGLRDWVLAPLGMGDSVWSGTQTSLYCTIADDLVPGAYYDTKCKGQRAPNKEAEDEGLQQQLYELSKKAVGLA